MLVALRSSTAATTTTATTTGAAAAAAAAWAGMCASWRICTTTAVGPRAGAVSTLHAAGAWGRHRALWVSSLMDVPWVRREDSI